MPRPGISTTGARILASRWLIACWVSLSWAKGLRRDFWIACKETAKKSRKLSPKSRWTASKHAFKSFCRASKTRIAFSSASCKSLSMMMARASFQVSCQGSMNSRVQSRVVLKSCISASKPTGSIRCLLKSRRLFQLSIRLPHSM